MRKIIQTLNKKSISDATGISYGRLRKYSSNEIRTLTEDEYEKIYNYLIELTKIFKQGENHNEMD